MTKDELFDLVAQGEGSDIGFRRSLGRELGRELCAFANGDGGTLLLGVSKSGEIAGVGSKSRARGRVLTTARSADPPIVVEVESVGDVLRVVVPPQKYKPYSIGWRAFVREGTISRRLSNAEIKDLFYAVGRAHFDKEPCENFSLEDRLDADDWDRFIQRAKIPAGMHMILALRRLGLVDAEDRMTHTGAWLLADDIRRLTPGAFVSCTFFEGTAEAAGREHRDFHSCIPTMVSDTLEWILTRINVQLMIWQEEGEGRPELPEEALREAIANAVAHRDYRSRESVQVRLSRDRLEIVSPGGLPEGMTETDLGTKSVPRNPLLYGMLVRMDVVGRIGSGIRRMSSLCREHGVEEPRIEVSGNRITTTFKRPSAIQVQPSAIQDEPSFIHVGGERAIRVGDRAAKQGNEQTLLWAGERAERPSYKKHTRYIQDRAITIQDTALTIQVRELVRVLDSDRSRVEILESLGLRNRSNLAANYLRPALDAGLIEMTIPDKPTSGRQKYRLTARGRALRAAL